MTGTGGTQMTRHIHNLLAPFYANILGIAVRLRPFESWLPVPGTHNENDGL